MPRSLPSSRRGSLGELEKPRPRAVKLPLPAAAIFASWRALAASVPVADRREKPMTRWNCWGLLVLLLAVMTAQQGRAAGKTARDLAARIDRAVEDKLRAEKVTPSAEASDAEFLRRASLDITGVIPTAEKAKAFLESADPDKRAKLIDELLASPDYGKRMADTWQALLLARPPNVLRYHPALFGKWLAESFNANNPWDRMVKELLTARGTEDENPAVIFFQANDSVDKMTDNVSKNLLGVQLQCAQCHNHPFADWKQDDYWGLAAFFLKVRADNNKIVKGGPPIVNEGPEIMARRFLPEATKFVPARYLQGGVQPLVRRAPFRPYLADWLTSPKNPFFAKAMVNRVWAQFFGRGLVNPVDDIGENNAASHPELLDQLARGFADNGFDLKDLIRAIVSSRAYQRTSRPAGDNDKSDSALLARMPVKMLSPEMLYDSLALITETAAPPPMKGQKPTALTPRQQFAHFFQAEDTAEPTTYTHGIPQVLRLMNSPQFHRSATQFHRSAKLDRLIAAGKPEEVIERLYLTVLSRRPTAEETAALLRYVRQGDARRNYGDVLWTLLNTSEFSLNH
jgi:hypothetical protein